jgi:hypothetical protein
VPGCRPPEDRPAEIKAAELCPELGITRRTFYRFEAPGVRISSPYDRLRPDAGPRIHRKPARLRKALRVHDHLRTEARI